MIAFEQCSAYGNMTSWFCCPMCTYKTHCAAWLRKHRVVHETNNRPHVCDICALSFKLLSHLNTHRQTHDQPSYACGFCDFKCLQKGSWTRIVASTDRSAHLNVSCASTRRNANRICRYITDACTQVALGRRREKKTWRTFLTRFPYATSASSRYPSSNAPRSMPG